MQHRDAGLPGFVAQTGRVRDGSREICRGANGKYRSSGSPRLDDAAVAAMHASACKPYKENGEAIRAAYSQPFVFGLDE